MLKKYRKLLPGIVAFGIALGVVIFLVLRSLYQNEEAQVFHSSSSNEAEEAGWTVGYGECEIIPENPEENPLYIAGYNSGWETSEFLDNNSLEVYREYRENWGKEPDYDYGQARAVWLDAGDGGILLIGVDCVALSGNYVAQIREELKALCEEVNCISVNVYATHSHAMPDTLGLWGPLGMDGKDSAYMETLVAAAVSAARQAVKECGRGELYYGSVTTEEMLRDSRHPLVYDPDIHQIRFAGEDGEGVRLLFYGAHAESMRGANRILSRDFPGVMCDLVTAQTGDRTLFLPGAIGGLIMTEELTYPYPFDAVENLQQTGKRLADYVLSIEEDAEEKLSPKLDWARTEIEVPLDNNAFLYYQFLGILNCKVKEGQSRTGYLVCSEMSVIQLGTVTIALIPGEIFPELVYGGQYGAAAKENDNPEPLKEIAASYGAEHLLILGLANDELGYIVPPSDFLVNKTNPYLEKTMDLKGENHYEETNSAGPECADVIAESFGFLMGLICNQDYSVIELQ